VLAKVEGLGGLFFKTADPTMLGGWCAAWPGLPVQAPSGARYPHAVLPLSVLPGPPDQAQQVEPVRKPHRRPLTRQRYDKEFLRLHIELVKLQDRVKVTGHRVVVIFEGRGAAGKGGVIKRIAEPLNPRIARVVVLGVPSEREKSQWYFQRFVARLHDPLRRWKLSPMDLKSRSHWAEYSRAKDAMSAHTDIKQAPW
jgi:polyphosphate kinase 2 (PPK2 family)